MKLFMKNNLSLVDEEVFELTLQKLRPHEPKQDSHQRAVARVKIFENHHKINGAFFPNLDHLEKELHENDHYERHPTRNIPEFQKELKASNHRLALAKNGVPLYKIFSQQSPRYCQIDPKAKFAGVTDLIKENIKFSVPKSRQITLVQPLSSRVPERINLVDRISFATIERQKFQKLIAEQDKSDILLRNEMIEHLNHANERRLRAAEAFYNDLAKNGLNVAQANYARSSQKSRLRVISQQLWWNDFIEFAYSQKVGQIEERFIKQIGRSPTIKGSEFAQLKGKMQSDPKYKRCLELLEWINNRCHIIDDETLSLLMSDRSAHFNPLHRSQRSTYTLSQSQINPTLSHSSFHN